MEQRIKLKVKEDVWAKQAKRIQTIIKTAEKILEEGLFEVVE